MSKKIRCSLSSLVHKIKLKLGIKFKLSWCSILNTEALSLNEGSTQTYKVIHKILTKIFKELPKWNIIDKKINAENPLVPNVKQKYFFQNKNKHIYYRTKQVPKINYKSLNNRKRKVEGSVMKLRNNFIFFVLNKIMKIYVKSD